MSDLNFFAPYKIEKKKSINTDIYIYGLVVLAGLIIIFSFGFNTIKLIILGKQTKNINEKLNASEIQLQLKEANNINSQINVLSKYNNSLIDIAKKVNERNNVSDEILNDISDNVPSSVAFKSIDVENNVLKISGTAGDWVSVAEYAHTLSELPIMQNVAVNSINQSGAVEGEYSFDIKCVLKEVN